MPGKVINPGVGRGRYPRPPRPICQYDGCVGIAISHGWCHRHSYYVRTYGDPDAHDRRSEPVRRWIDRLMFRNFQAADGLLRFDPDGNDLPMVDDGTLVPCSFRKATKVNTMRVNEQIVNVYHYITTIYRGERPQRYINMRGNWAEYEVSHLCGNGHLGCLTQFHMVWDTHKGNTDMKWVHDTYPIGTRAKNAVLDEDKVLQILKLWDRGYSATDLSDMFSTSRSNIHNITRRTTWKHVRWP